MALVCCSLVCGFSVVVGCVVSLRESIAATGWLKRRRKSCGCSVQKFRVERFLRVCFSIFPFLLVWFSSDRDPFASSPPERYDNFDAQEERGAYGSSAYAYDGATFGTGGMGGGGGGGGGGDGDMRGVPQEADL